MTEDTEFNDILRRHGILPPRPASPASPSPPGSPSPYEALEALTAEELRELGEDITDEDITRTAEILHRKRLAEQRNEIKRARFGRVYPISRDSYTSEVTDASRINEEGDQGEKGTAVVCFLYKDGIPRSDRTFGHIRDLATRYPRTKFVSIVGDKCIADLPDSRIPMLIVYRKGEIRNQLVAWGADHEKSFKELEAILMMSGALDPSDYPSQRGERSQDQHYDSDEEDINDQSLPMRSAVTGSNARTPKNIRGSQKKEDSDSEFEFDM